MNIRNTIYTLSRALLLAPLIFIVGSAWASIDDGIQASYPLTGDANEESNYEY